MSGIHTQRSSSSLDTSVRYMPMPAQTLTQTLETVNEFKQIRLC